MRTITEFVGKQLKDFEGKLAQLKTEAANAATEALKAEGKTEEEIAGAIAEKTTETLNAKITEATKLEGDKLVAFLAAVELVAGKKGNLKRVVVGALNENEKAPSSAVEKDGKIYVVEFFADAARAAAPARDERGGRDGKRGGRGGKGGKGGGRDGKGRGDSRGPRSDRSQERSGEPRAAGAPGAPGERTERAPRPAREPREPRAPRAPRPPREPREEVKHNGLYIGKKKGPDAVAAAPATTETPTA